MNRMRTIENAAKYVKMQDPDTALTKTAIRQMVLSGELPSVKVGVNATKYLINLDTLDRYLAGERFDDKPMTQPRGVIRMVRA